MHEYVPHPLDESNGFVDNLRKYWVPNTHFLVFASDPSNSSISEHIKRELQDTFSLSDFSIAEIRYFDYQYIENFRSQNKTNPDTAATEALRDALQWADVFFLAGGHAPTENAFMKEELAKLPIRLYESAVNYFFFQAPGVIDLDKKMEKHGIMIRNCSNYVNLGDDYFRVAVRNREDNLKLIHAMKE